jgi:tetratricopeptide (TPR) repeat protein
MRKYFFFFVFLLSSALSFAQRQNIDSMLRILSSQGQDTSRVLTLIEISWEYRAIGEMDKALQYGNEGIALAEKLDYALGRAQLYSNTGAIHHSLSHYSKAIELFEKALELYEKLGGTAGRGGIYNNLGFTYFTQSNYPKAIECYFKALKLKEEAGDKESIPSTLVNIGNVFYTQDDLPKALDYYSRALEMLKGFNDQEALAVVVSNMGLIHNDMGDTAKARVEYLQSMAIHIAMNDRHGEALTINNIGVMYFELGEKLMTGEPEKSRKLFGLALTWYFKSMEIFKDIQDKEGECLLYVNYARVYIDMGEYKNAVESCKLAIGLARSVHLLDNVKDAELVLSDAYERSGDNQNALKHYKIFVEMRDSLFNEENTRKNVSTEMQFEFDKKEAATKLEQEKREAVTQAESKKQKVIIFSVCGILLLVAIFAVFAFRSYRQKQRANIEITTQKEIIEEKQKEILDSIYYARRIQQSLMTSEKYISKKLEILNKK